MNRLATGVLVVTGLLVVVLAVPALWRDPMGMGVVSVTLFAAVSAALLVAAWGTHRDRWWSWLIAAIAGVAGLLSAWLLAEAAAKGGPLEPDDWAWVATFGVGGGLLLTAAVGRFLRRARAAAER